MTAMFEDHADYEFNAQFDSVREAYAATALDGWREGYCDYCFECREYGDEPMDFAAWKADQQKPRIAAPAPVDYSNLDAIPF